MVEVVEEKTKLPRALVEPWIVALRSGKYKQCKHRLQSEDGGSYCCLGVYNVVHNIPMVNKLGADNYSAVQELLDQDKSILWHMNDSGRKSFEEIADYIEQNYELVDEL